MTRAKRRGLSVTPSPLAEPSPPPTVWGPGRCQVCNAFGPVGQYWPTFLASRRVDVCENCLKLGDEEIESRLDMTRRKDGAVI